MKLAYWKKYNRLLNGFSSVGLYRLVLLFAQRLGSPYGVSRFGRKHKVLPVEYAAYVSFMIFMYNAAFRVMELESEVYLGVHVDHSTLAVNFEKVPCGYFLDLVEHTGAYLDRLLELSDQYVVDSTALTTPLKFNASIKGKIVEERIEFRIHTLVSLHPKDNCVCIRKVLPTTKHVPDCDGAAIMLSDQKTTNVTLHADRGYDYERVYKACKDNNIKPNIKPQAYKITEGSLREQAIYKYDNQKRKKYRGIIETVFGGLTNAKLFTTRLKKPPKILAYGAITHLRHNILNIARNMNY